MSKLGQRLIASAQATLDALDRGEELRVHTPQEIAQRIMARRFAALAALKET